MKQVARRLRDVSPARIFLVIIVGLMLFAVGRDNGQLPKGGLERGRSVAKLKADRSRFDALREPIPWYNMASS
jgi:hypothetical protein